VTNLNKTIVNVKDGKEPWTIFQMIPNLFIKSILQWLTWMNLVRNWTKI
jgi:hypothetical protein